MNPAYLSNIAELQKSMQAHSGIQSGLATDRLARGVHAGVAILVQDAVCQRLVESASRHLDLETVLLTPEALYAGNAASDAAPLNSFELIVADRQQTPQIRSILERESRGEGVSPAVIAVVPAQSPPLSPDPAECGADSVLTLPQLPAPLAAQLSVILYAHRAFALRYQDAMDELHLNRRIFRSVTSGISVANALAPDCPLTYVNPAFEAMTGYSLEEVTGKNCRFLQGAEREQPAVAQLREAIRAGTELTVVMKNFRKDGSQFWNELSLSPIRNRDGQITHFVGIQTDVTSRVEIEAALRESEKLAAVGRLASSIAHEINNPLESVMNLIYLAQHAEDASQLKQYLNMADRELERVKLITTQSLRFFKQSTRPTAVFATPLLDSVLDLYHSRLMNAHTTVVRRDRSTSSVLCMESEVRQVLNNLVSNAIDAMNHEATAGCSGRQLLVRTREGAEPKTGRPGLVITIADTGGGIAPDTLKNIYRAFYTTKGIGGTGLGLWISSEIVERHQGRMLVRSSTNAGRHGTVFALYLPYVGVVKSKE